MPNGNLCVSDTGNHRLLVVSADSGEVITSFGKGGGAALGGETHSPSSSPPGHRSPSPTPSSTALMPYAVAGDTPVSVTPLAEPVRRRERRAGTLDRARLRGPRGLAADDQAVYVADCYNCLVKKFSLVNGALLASAGGYGEAEGKLRYPYGLALS